MPFLLKSLISHLLHPVPMLVAVAVLGLLLCFWRRTRKAAKYVFAADAVLFLVFAFGLLNPLLKRLELAYPPFPGDDAVACEKLRGAAIVVLGQGLETEPLPARFGVNDCFRQRLTEAAYVAHKVPESRVIVSVSGKAPAEHKRKAMEAFAATYGLPMDAVDYFIEARDTVEEVRDAKPFIGERKVIAVTSASHMRRALGVFRTAGYEAVPAPCEYLYFGPETRFTWRDGHFGPRNFERAERVIHEYIGLLYEKLR